MATGTATRCGYRLRRSRPTWRGRRPSSARRAALRPGSTGRPTGSSPRPGWRLSPAQLAKVATRGVGPGDVILLHDADWYSRPGSHRITAAAVAPILAELDRRGLKPVTPSRETAA